MYLTHEEIKKLKSDLMSRQSKGTTASTNKKKKNPESIAKIVSREVKKVRNGEIGIIFEENIRKTLEVEYGWQISNIPRHFFYRNISSDDETCSLAPFEYLNFKDFSISLEWQTNDCIIQYERKNKNKKIVKVNETNSVSNININNTNFAIGPPQEVELGGVFQEIDFDELPFDKNEVVILFNNTPKKKYDCAIVEIKLSAQKLEELIEQLKKDKDVMNNFIEKSTVYIGFVNINKCDSDFIHDFNFDDACGRFKCILLGIKNGTFCERNITFPIDWKIVSQFYHFKNEINEKLEEMKSEFGELRTLIKGLETKIDAMKPGNNKFLKRKRRRNFHK